MTPADRLKFVKVAVNAGRPNFMTFTYHVPPDRDVVNGEVVHEVPLRDWANNKGKLPLLKFKRSGWFLVRAVTTADKTYRFAMTGPYYVEIGYKKRVSKKSAQFFLDWVYERAKQIKLPDTTEKKAVLAKHRVARDFFQELVSKANAP